VVIRAWDFIGFKEWWVKDLLFLMLLLSPVAVCAGVFEVGGYELWSKIIRLWLLAPLSAVTVFIALDLRGLPARRRRFGAWLHHRRLLNQYWWGSDKQQVYALTKDDHWYDLDAPPRYCHRDWVVRSKGWKYPIPSEDIVRIVCDDYDGKS